MILSVIRVLTIIAFMWSKSIALICKRPALAGFAIAGVSGVSANNAFNADGKLSEKILERAINKSRMYSTACDSAVQNPLMNKKHVPLFAEIDASHVLPAVESDLNALKAEFAEFENVLENPQSGNSWKENRVEYDYTSIIEHLEKIQYSLSYSWGVVGHLMGVKNSEDIRSAHKTMQPQVIEAYQKIGQSQALFKGLCALRKRESEWSKLDEAQQRIVNSSIRQMEDSGVGLEPTKRAAFNKLQLEAAELSTKFSNNVLDSTKAFKLRITDKSKIDGLPASAVGMAAQQAVANGDEGATAESGPWVITLDMPSYLPAMQHLKDRDLREELYKGFTQRASSGEHDNVPIIKRILQIKKEMSALLGYKCFAEKSLAAKMAPTVESVLELTEMLREKSFPAAEKEMKELNVFAKESGFKEEGNLALWDVPYWSERLREKLYEYEEEELRPYFALPSVLDGLFGLAGRLFGVTVEAADGEVQVWDKDVRFFNIKDNETGEKLASFYLDPYSRPGEKRGGAWMDTCLGKSRAVGTNPVAYLVCNGSPPVGDKPSLMTFREVETLFHEFGHGLQHMLTRVPYGDAAGINNVEWDAVELPSQFMENWCYDKPTLYAFAKHYETGAKLPDELFEKIRAAKNFQAGLGMLRQLFFGAMDMKLHSDYDPYSEQSPFEIQHELAQSFTVLPPLKEDRFLCAFGHIFAGGYSAGYYSYKWAEVMSADAFAAFEEAGLDDEKAVHETGRLFRETVLAMGGGAHPTDVYKKFRGREPSPLALLKHSGLLGDDK